MNEAKEYLKSIETLPDERENIEFWERENKKSHTSYETEILFYSSIMHGDTEELGKYMQQMFADGVIVGRMSEDSLRQTKYLAVSSITIATRYAIQGGLPEMEAYNLSDSCIREVDLMENELQIIDFLTKKSFEITNMIKNIRTRHNYPSSIRKCVTFIDKNLHSKISLEELAEESGLSKDYLSQLFKKVTGVTVTEYIKKRRLSSAKQLLDRGTTLGDTAYGLGFCSESYFISCFKKEYGITPKEYIATKGKL